MYNTKYNITKNGSVISFQRSPQGKILTPSKNQDGFYTIDIYYLPNKYKKLSIHRLVAEQFIPNPHQYKFVKHIDGDKRNNNVNNLEWVKRY